MKTHRAPIGAALLVCSYSAADNLRMSICTIGKKRSADVIE